MRNNNLVKARIANTNVFDNLLFTLAKFTKQCELDISKTGVAVFSKNTQSFSSSKLILKSNCLVIDSSSSYSLAKMGVRDIMALRSAIMIAKATLSEDDASKNVLEVILRGEPAGGEDKVFTVNELIYAAAEGGSFSVKAIGIDIISDFVSKDVSTAIKPDCSFNVNVKNLDILQNKTAALIKLDDVNKFIYEKNGKIVMELSKVASDDASKFTNSISLPIASSYDGESLVKLMGSANEAKTKSMPIFIAESSFRIFNILKVVDSKDIRCSILQKFKALIVDSRVEDDGFFIDSRLLVQQVYGK